METWAPMQQFEGHYEVSTLGNVRNARTKKNLTLCNGWGAYLQVYPQIGGKKTALTVHRAVALAFINNPRNHKEVNHKNGDKYDNRVSNLEWVTHRENMRHALRTGLMSSPESGIGVRSPAAKLTQAQADDIRLRVARGQRRKDVTRRYGFKSKSTVLWIIANVSYPMETA